MSFDPSSKESPSVVSSRSSSIYEKVLPDGDNNQDIPINNQSGNLDIKSDDGEYQFDPVPTDENRNVEDTTDATPFYGNGQERQPIRDRNLVASCRADKSEIYDEHMSNNLNLESPVERYGNNLDTRATRKAELVQISGSRVTRSSADSRNVIPTERIRPANLPKEGMSLVLPDARRMGSEVNATSSPPVGGSNEKNGIVGAFNNMMPHQTTSDVTSEDQPDGSTQPSETTRMLSMESLYNLNDQNVVNTDDSTKPVVLNDETESLPSELKDETTPNAAKETDVKKSSTGVTQQIKAFFNLDSPVKTLPAKRENEGPSSVAGVVPSHKTSNSVTSKRPMSTSTPRKASDSNRSNTTNATNNRLATQVSDSGDLGVRVTTASEELSMISDTSMLDYTNGEMERVLREKAKLEGQLEVLATEARTAIRERAQLQVKNIC